jgi:KUP system potassium uptake protein
MMLVWFSMGYLVKSQNILKYSFNPYAYNLLSIHPDGFFVLGFVFLYVLQKQACVFRHGTLRSKEILELAGFCKNNIGS